MGKKWLWDIAITREKETHKFKLGKEAPTEEKSKKSALNQAIGRLSKRVDESAALIYTNIASNQYDLQIKPGKPESSKDKKVKKNEPTSSDKQRGLFKPEDQ